VTTSYTVKTEHFQGPLDLLLNLIEKRKLFINDISLALIADDYIKYVEDFPDFPLRDASNFILIASTLVLIKSKSLVPSLNLTEEEESGIDDLELRLKLYKEFKDISKRIEEIFGKKIIFNRLPSKDLKVVFSPPDKLSLTDIQNSINDILKNLPQKEKVPQATVRKVISLEEMMDNLSERIQSNLRMSFKNFASKEEKMDAIVGFLAMLELVKRGIIAVRQEGTFKDIEMEHNNPGVPNYS
jgi:segregation and condensation protein A